VKWRCRDRKSGYWLMWRKRKSSHLRPSIILYNELGRNYVATEGVERFFDLPADKRNQLKRVYQEMVCYLPWQDNPDKTFLSSEVLKELESSSDDPDAAAGTASGNWRHITDCI
jgi:hypothetical protein